MANIKSLIEEGVVTDSVKAIRHDLDAVDFNRKSDRIVVRKAAREDVSLIKSWIHDAQEFEWLGGETYSNFGQEVTSWICSQYGAFVLEKHSKNGERTPLAFASIQEFGSADNEIEAGHLVVDRNYRNKNVGRTFIDYLAISVANSENIKDFIVNARVLKSNAAAKAMFKHSLFNLRPTPDWAPQEPPCEWYRCTLHVSPVEVAETVAKFRKIRRYDQSTLGAICGVTRETITALENGRMKPGWDVLYRLAAGLGRTRREHHDILLAMFGEQLGNEFVDTTTIEQELGGKRKHLMHLWVIVDEPAELTDAMVLEGSVEALMKGFQRYYFLPPGKWQGPAGEGIKTRILTTVKRSISEGVGWPRSLSCLRFYEAPAALCSLRIAIHNPSQDVPRTGTKPEEVTIGGGEGRRVPLDPTRAEDLMRQLHRVVMELQDQAKRDTARENRQSEGFRLLWIIEDERT